MGGTTDPAVAVAGLLAMADKLDTDEHGWGGDGGFSRRSPQISADGGWEI